MIAVARRLWRRPLAIVGCLLIALHFGLALAAPLLVRYDPLRLLDAPLERPSMLYWLGTDELGRDFYSRVIMGGQTEIIVALSAGLISTLLGGLIGLVAAYYRGLVDDVISRYVEMKLALPSILLVSLFVAGFGQSLLVLVAVISLIKMVGVVRTTRAQGIVLMQTGYVKAAQLRGQGGFSIIFTELFPNVLDLLSVEFALRFSSALLLVSALSFLGLGISPPTPDWGLMIHDGLPSIRSEPLLILAPALCISSLVIGINFATEGLADAFGLDAARGTAGH